MPEMAKKEVFTWRHMDVQGWYLHGCIFPKRVSENLVPIALNSQGPFFNIINYFLGFPPNIDLTRHPLAWHFITNEEVSNLVK